MDSMSEYGHIQLSSIIAYEWNWIRESPNSSRRPKPLFLVASVCIDVVNRCKMETEIKITYVLVCYKFWYTTLTIIADIDAGIPGSKSLPQFVANSFFRGPLKSVTLYQTSMDIFRVDTNFRYNEIRENIKIDKSAHSSITSLRACSGATWSMQSCCTHWKYQISPPGGRKPYHGLQFSLKRTIRS